MRKTFSALSGTNTCLSRCTYNSFSHLANILANMNGSVSVPAVSSWFLLFLFVILGCVQAMRAPPNLNSDPRVPNSDIVQKCALFRDRVMNLSIERRSVFFLTDPLLRILETDIYARTAELSRCIDAFYTGGYIVEPLDRSAFQRRAELTVLLPYVAIRLGTNGDDDIHTIEWLVEMFMGYSMWDGLSTVIDYALREDRNRRNPWRIPARINAIFSTIDKHVGQDGWTNLQFAWKMLRSIMPTDNVEALQALLTRLPGGHQRVIELLDNFYINPDLYFFYNRHWRLLIFWIEEHGWDVVGWSARLVKFRDIIVAIPEIPENLVAKMAPLCDALGTASKWLEHKAIIFDKNFLEPDVLFLSHERYRTKFVERIIDRLSILDPAFRDHVDEFAKSAIGINSPLALQQLLLHGAQPRSEWYDLAAQNCRDCLVVLP